MALAVHHAHHAQALEQDGLAFAEHLFLARQGLGIIFTTHAPDHAHALADRTLILSPTHPPRLGPTADLLTEATLTDAYGVPIRLVRADGHVACVAVVE